MPAALERSYDGIIIGAGHHGLVLGSYLARCRPRHPAGGPPPAIRRRTRDRGSDRTRLLSQPAFDQSFPHQRDALVQGFGPRRPRHLHHAALRVRPATPRRHRRSCSGATSRRRSPTSRASPRRTPRPSATGTARPRRSRAASSCRSASPSRCHEPSARRCCRAAPSVAISSRSTKRQPFDVVQELFENEHVQLLFLFKISLFGTWLVDTMSKTQPHGLGDPRLRPAKRLPALPGRLGQPGARR